MFVMDLSTKRIALVAGLLTFLVGGALWAQQSREVTLPEGSPLRLSFDKALSSATSKAGESFTATVSESISVGSRVIVPKGSKIEGAVTVAKPAKKGVVGVQHKEGELDVRWSHLILPNGVRKEIAAHALALDDPQNKGKVKDGEGTMTGESSVKRDVLQTGIGTGIGAAIGAIAGGGKGTAIGAAIGASAGLGSSAFRKGHEIEVKAGTPIVIQLDRPVSFVGAELAHAGSPAARGSSRPARTGAATSKGNSIR